MPYPPVLSKDTLVPLSAIVALAAGIIWLSTMYVTVQNTAERLEKLEQKMDTVYERTARIEATLNALSTSGNNLSLK